MNKLVLALATVVALQAFGSDVKAQNYYEYGNANSTPYSAPRFERAPRYIQQLGRLGARRYYAPQVRPYLPKWVSGGMIKGGGLSGAVIYFTNPDTAYAPGVE